MSTKLAEVVIDPTTATANREKNAKHDYARQLKELLRHAEYDGFVITVELEPLEPLAMGNYRMVGHVRGAR